MVGAVVLVATAVVVGVMDPFAGGHSAAPNGTGKSADPTSLHTVADQELSSQTEVSAILGYADSYTVVNQAQGTVTSLPAVGQVTTQGQVLYEVSGVPVVLLYGSTPAFRTLSEGVTGADVEQLNADLVALGYVTSTELSPTSVGFTYWTEEGVEKLQKALGVTQNGTLSLGQEVFEPSAVRVTSVSATLGAPAQPGQSVLSATSTTPSNQRRPRCGRAVRSSRRRQGDDHASEQSDHAGEHLIGGHGGDHPSVGQLE